MNMKQYGGVTEFIPSPEEKRSQLLNKYSFEMLVDLNKRVRVIEHLCGMEVDYNFEDLVENVLQEERENLDINQRM